MRLRGRRWNMRRSRRRSLRRCWRWWAGSWPAIRPSSSSLLLHLDAAPRQALCGNVEPRWSPAGVGAAGARPGAPPGEALQLAVALHPVTVETRGAGVGRLYAPAVVLDGLLDRAVLLGEAHQLQADGVDQ